MNLAVMILGLLNGGYMLADGVHVLVKGKYIGPARPGPWALAWEKLGIDVFRLGPLFVLLGLAWLTFIALLWSGHRYAYPLGLCVSVATLWYLPVGTVISIVVLAMLLFARQRLGV